MSTKSKSGISQNTSFDDRGETIIDEGSYLRESKCADWRYEWEERKQYRCKIINEKGVVTICSKLCSQCDYYLRRKSNKISIDRLYDEHGFEFASDDPTPEEAYQQKELEEKVDEAINALPTKELRMIARMVGDGCSIRDIAKTLNIPSSTAFDKWNKAKKLLKAQLQDYWDSLH